MRKLAFFLCAGFAVSPLNGALAGTTIPLTVNLSESVTVTGTPRVVVDVGGQTRYATYTSGSGTSTLTFTLSPQAGDVDLDGIAVSSPIDLNGGTVKDAAGNNATLTFTPPNTSGIKVNYPSLGMDFVYDADGRYTLNGTVYNDLTSFLAATGGSFTRASTATYFDSTGTLQTAASGVPRFDYDPVTHIANGILLEESRANLYKYSGDFSNALWVKARSIVVTNATQAPDGTMTGAHLSDNGVSGGSYIRQSLSYSANTKYAISIYAKKAELDRPRIDWNAGSGWASDGMVIFNLTTGTATTSGTVDSYSMVSVGNGWYRCTAVATFGAVAQSSNYPAFTMHTNLLDSTSGFYVWGAQIEQASFSSSYIPTTSTTVTRARDIFSIPVSGTWYGATSGTAFVAFDLPNLTSASGMGIFSLYTGSNNGYLLYKGAGIAGLYAYANANLIYTGNLSPAATAKATLAYDPTSAYTTYNGSSVLSFSNATVATPTNLLFGGNWYGNQMTGYLKKFKFYPTRIADNELELLTQ